MSAHLKYLSYVIRHKWFVLQAGLKTGAPLWRLLIHDWSKFLPSEWFPYVRYFYGDAEVYRENERCFKASGANCGPWLSQVALSFDRAWLHHQHLNKHHWQHWVLSEDSGETKVLEMPDKYLREMVADWTGAGRAITGKWEAQAWYLKNRDIIQLHYATRLRVEQLLGLPSNAQ